MGRLTGSSWALLALLGCEEKDPLVEAWHGTVAVDLAEVGEGTCDPEMEEVIPDLPWLFVATQPGVPDVSSLYWCAGEASCNATPWASVWINHWTETELAGEFVSTVYLGTMCTAQWTGLEATRTDAGDVDLWVRTYTGQLSVDKIEDCDEFAAAVAGQGCDAVHHYTGAQVDPR